MVELQSTCRESSRYAELCSYAWLKDTDLSSLPKLPEQKYIIYKCDAAFELTKLQNEQSKVFDREKIFTSQASQIASK